MKQIIFRICFLMLLSSQAWSQQTHFIYLQTENREPFYVALNKKNYSSSTIGYVILPKLVNGEYNIRIGFPKNSGAEQDYVLQVKDNEQGYLVKNLGDKGWALFNLQSLELQYAGVISKERRSLAAQQLAEAKLQEEALAKQKSDEQAALLAKEKQEALAAETLRKAAELAALSAKEKTDSIPATTNTLSKDPINNKKELDTEAIALIKKNEDAAVAEAQLKADSEKLAAAEAAKLSLPETAIKPIDAVAPQLIKQTKTDSGVVYKYAVSNTDGKDTVNAFIKGANLNAVATSQEVLQPKEIAITEKAAPKDTLKFLDIDFKQDSDKNEAVLIVPVFKKENPAPIPDVKKTDSVVTIVAKPATEISIPKWDNNVRLDSAKSAAGMLPNSNCKAQADEKDFFNLRKRMAAEEGADEMVLLAKKTMKEKCFSTTQVRNLSVLFLSDAERYQFLDAVYAFTYDAYQYDTLQDLLKESYYLQRFKTMIRK